VPDPVLAVGGPYVERLSVVFRGGALGR